MVHVDEYDPADVLAAVASATDGVTGLTARNGNAVSTWSLHFASTATAEQKTAATAALLAYVPAAPVPSVVPLWKARAALRQANVFDAVAAAVAASNNAVMQEAWEYAAEVRRDSAFIAALAPAIGLTSAQLDTLFIAADSIAG